MLVAAMIAGLSDAAMGLRHYYCLYSHCPFSIAVSAATALDLSKLIIEYSNTPNAEMNGIVLSALQTEAKQILN